MAHGVTGDTRRQWIIAIGADQVSRLYLSVMVTSGQRQQQRPQSEAAAWRVFAAVPVSDDVRELMRRAEETLAPRGWPMKWVKPELAHLTLKFYGNISTDRLSDLSMRLATVAAGAGALRIRTTTVGAFPSAARPRVIWLGLALSLIHISEPTRPY